MNKCITVIKHFITLVFISVCGYEVSHVITKWINKESFQGEVDIFRRFLGTKPQVYVYFLFLRINICLVWITSEKD